MEIPRYWNVTALIDNKRGKRHVLRIGSAVTIKEGIVVNIETAPLNWDGVARLTPVPEGTPNE
jgi:hypothetical protein